jgi:hypothetical protein
MPMLHLPQIVFYVAYGFVGFIVVALILLAILKFRNRNLR